MPESASDGSGNGENGRDPGTMNKGRAFYDDSYAEEVESLNDRIHFDPDQFYGREKELKTLHSVYQTMTNRDDNDNNSKTPVVLISGYSGCGKTRLVTQFIRQIEKEQQSQQGENTLQPQQTQDQEQQPPEKRKSPQRQKVPSSKPPQSNRSFVFLSGKCDNVSQCADPFSSISQAFSGFCSYLLQEENIKELESVRNDVTRVMGAGGGALQVGALTTVVPLLRSVLAESIATSASSTTTNTPKRPQTPGAQVALRKAKRHTKSVKKSGSSNNINSSVVSTPFVAGSIMMNRDNNAWNSLKYLFLALVKAMCRPYRPMILFLDDLQWVDSSSLDLITALLTDKALNYFMFIGAVRSTEVDTNHVVIKRLEQLHHHQQQTNNQRVPLERIELLNLSQSEIGVFLADVLRLSVEETSPLTGAIYGKTRGNIFFAMQALEELERNKVLYYSVISFRWEWNLNLIMENNDPEGAPLSDNVVEAVAAKIQTAPPNLQQALVVAAYTRSTIDLEILRDLMAANDCIVPREELKCLLDQAVLDGLLSNNVGSTTYKFAHDRIQEAATSLALPGQERNDLRVKIGKRLFEIASSEDCIDDYHNGINFKANTITAAAGSSAKGGNDWMLFVAADHLNATISKDVSTLYKAKLNLRVGERATSFAAFVPASMYLRKSLEALRSIPNHWKEHYYLSLRLYRAISDVELVLGNYELGNDLGQQVLDHTKELQDKLPTYLSLAVARGTQERHEESMDLVRTALLLLGEYPKQFYLVHLMIAQTAVKNYFKKHTDDDIVMLPMMTDETKMTAMGFLKEATIRTYHCGNMIEFMLVVLRMLRTTFQYGLSGFSAHAFACYGLFLSGAYGDQEGGTRMARLAREVLDLTKAKHLEGLVLYTISYFIDAFAVPHDKMLETYQRAHRSGMETGDLETGFRNWLSSNYHAYVSGYPLDPVEKTGTELVEQLQLYNVESILSLTMEIRLPIRYLAGRSDRPLNWEELVEEVPEYSGNASDTFRFLHAYLGRLELAVYMRELEVAEKMADKLVHIASNDSAYLPLTCRTFFTGLMASGLAHKTGLVKYRRRSRMLTAEMKRIVRTRGPNCLPKYLILQADLLACQPGKKQMEKIQVAYDEAVSAALKIGATQDAALASELAGEFFSRAGDDERRKQYFQQAHDLYLEWGAKAKLDHLQRHWGLFIERSSSFTQSLTHNGVSADKEPQFSSSQGPSDTYNKRDVVPL